MELITVEHWDISIHAPTRGATRFRFGAILHSHYFNPRSHKGSDLNISGQLE